MNRYPFWKNFLIGLVLIIGLIYTLPNFFGEEPAVQISPSHASLKVNDALQSQVMQALQGANIQPKGFTRDEKNLRVRFDTPDTQIKARDVIEHSLNPDPKVPSYVVALNLMSASPHWLTAMHALPMYLGLDLRGGVHFLLQVDMKGALTKQLDADSAELRGQLREKGIRYAGIRRNNENLVLLFRDEENRLKAKRFIQDIRREFTLVESKDSTDGDLLLTASLTKQAMQQIQENSIKQNMTTLHNRINELGVAEPVIQQQGADRIVVQLPGVQDVAKAKDLIGRTATLEVRLVNESTDTIGSDFFPEVRDGRSVDVPLKKQVVLTGDRFIDAQAAFDSNHQPAVAVRLDSAGGRIMRDVTRENIHKRMAIILIEKGRGEAISVATIQSEFSNNFQITGNFSTEETNRLSILIRSGSLAAPMEIIEERTVGPSLGAANIAKGFHSTLWGFIAIAAFMTIYYRLFGLISTLALAANLLLLIALLSLIQATLTLPGIAAIALTLGMAIDANVLINERIREELRNGASPQAAIMAGYDRAFATILDSNVTTFIAGLALLIFGSGPVRGFAVVHCLGILTSMFSAVLVSRMLTNFIYGNRRKIENLSIGQIWKPTT